jgi:hypothetical protein
VPFDPDSKGGSEATVRIAKADLVPTDANLPTGYDSFAELAAACAAFCDRVNGWVHRETGRARAEGEDPPTAGLAHVVLTEGTSLRLTEATAGREVMNCPPRGSPAVR